MKKYKRSAASTHRRVVDFTSENSRRHVVAFVAREPLANVLPSSSLRGPHASARDRAGWSVEAPLAMMAERFGFETGKLMMSQFRSRTRIGRKKRLLEEAEKILRSGAVEQPKWFNALKT